MPTLEINKKKVSLEKVKIGKEYYLIGYIDTIELGVKPEAILKGQVTGTLFDPPHCPVLLEVLNRLL